MKTARSIKKMLSVEARARVIWSELSRLPAIKQHKKLSYRKHIVRQLHAQYVEGIYSNSVTLTSRLGVTQCHWKLHHSTDHIWVPISVSRKSWNFYTLTVFSAPKRGDPVGLSRRCLKLDDWTTVWWRNCDDMLSCFATIRDVTDRWTDRQTDRISISISSVGMLTHNKNTQNKTQHISIECTDSVICIHILCYFRT